MRGRSISAAAAMFGTAFIICFSLPAFGQGLEGQGETPDAALVATLDRFSDWTTSVAFSPDGKLLAIGTYESIRLWDVEQEEATGELRHRKGFARALAFSPDGDTLAVGGYQSVALWNIDERKLVAEFKGHRGYVTSLCFSPDGTQLASASEDLTARLWNVSDGTEVAKFEGHTHPVLGVAISPDGQLVATAAGDEARLTKPGEVKTWSIETGNEVHTFPPHERGATGVAFSPDGALLVSTSLDEKVNIYNVEAGDAHGFFGGHSRPTNCVQFAGGGKLVITGSGGRFKGKNEVKFFSPQDGEEFGTIDHHGGKVTAIALSPNGRLLATASYDKSAAVWDISNILERAGVDSAAAETVALADDDEDSEEILKIGIIGLDTSHAIAFTNLLNSDDPPEALTGCRIVAAYPKGSPDIESSTSRVPKYTEDVKAKGVEIVESIDELLEKVDAVCLETNDGRPHLEQVLPVLKAGKPVFIDKPIAGSLTDAVAIVQAAQHYGVPMFSSSSLRWLVGAQEIRNGSIGAVTGADMYSPCSLEETHPDLFWYGIHGVESLFTVMGTGCESVSRTSTPDFDFAVGTWEGGRIGSFRGIRRGQGGYGGTVFGEEGKAVLNQYGGYQPLVEAIIHMFRTGETPVTHEETLEIYAFMEAADESKRQGGSPVTLESVMEKARAEAAEKLEGQLD